MDGEGKAKGPAVVVEEVPATRGMGGWMSLRFVMSGRLMRRLCDASALLGGWVGGVDCF